KGTKITNRGGDNPCRFAIPGTLSIRTGTYVDGILQYTGNRAVILWRDEDNGIHVFYLSTKRGIRLRCIPLVIILIVQRKLPNLDAFQLIALRCMLHKVVGYLFIEGFLA